MTTDAARKAVFNTSELLESILVCLPPKTIFGVQRVSKQFQAVIATSTPIQEKMFLRVRNEPQRRWVLKEQATVSGVNRYFVESANDAANRNSRLPTGLNPFLSNFAKTTCTKRTRETPAIENVSLGLEQPLSLTMLREGAPSILRTYISDPPPRDIKVIYSYRFPDSQFIRVFSAKVEGAKNSGIRTVDFAIRDMVIPTDDARAAVKSREKRVEGVFTAENESERL